MSGTAQKHKYCFKCGTRMSSGAIYCPNCRASQTKPTNKANQAASALCSFLFLIGFILVILGIIMVVGSLIGLAMKSTMENPATHRAWAIGQIFYYLFIETGFIDVSLGLGFAFIIIGVILFVLGERGSR